MTHENKIVTDYRILTQMFRNDRIITNISNDDKMNVIYTTKNYSFFNQVSYFKLNSFACYCYLYILLSRFGINVDKICCMTFQWAE
jgi:hypothetical protein